MPLKIRLSRGGAKKRPFYRVVVADSRMPRDGPHLLVGVIGAAHGVRGEVRVKSYTGEPSAIASYGPLLDESGMRSFEFEGLRRLRADLFVARFKGIADRGSAEALAHTKL